MARQDTTRRPVTAAEALTPGLRRQVAALRSAENEVRAGTPEAVHHFRVATRRLRSNLSGFEPLLDARTCRILVDDLQRTARAVGPAQDAVVVRRQVDALLGTHAGRGSGPRARSARTVARAVLARVPAARDRPSRRPGVRRAHPGPRTPRRPPPVASRGAPARGRGPGAAAALRVVPLPPTLPRRPGPVRRGHHGRPPPRGAQGEQARPLRRRVADRGARPSGRTPGEDGQGCAAGARRPPGPGPRPRVPGRRTPRASISPGRRPASWRGCATPRPWRSRRPAKTSGACSAMSTGRRCGPGCADECAPRTGHRRLSR